MSATVGNNYKLVINFEKNDYGNIYLILYVAVIHRWNKFYVMFVKC